MWLKIDRRHSRAGHLCDLVVCVLNILYLKRIICSTMFLEILINVPRIIYGEFFPHIIRLDAKHSFMPCSRPFFILFYFCMPSLFRLLPSSRLESAGCGVRVVWRVSGSSSWCSRDKISYENWQLFCSSSAFLTHSLVSLFGCARCAGDCTELNLCRWQVPLKYVSSTESVGVVCI